MNIMVNGLPGKMASAVVNAIVDHSVSHQKNNSRPDFSLVPYSLCSSRHDGYFPVGREGSYLFLPLIKPDQREEMIAIIKKEHPGCFISIDYTVPDAVNDNANFYCQHNLPFVMGTTGGDRNALEERVRQSNTVAVIAPNMATPIVVFQAMMEYAASHFPRSLGQYQGRITESHQARKKDTSGTAKAVVGSLQQLGVSCSVEEIDKIRSVPIQLEAGIPAEFLEGHGWHTYTLRSPDGTVKLEFTHNVNGRRVYAEGTLRAIQFLEKKIQAGEKGKVYTMIDVLREN